MKRIRFLTQQTYETGGPGRGPVFAEGLELDAAGVGAALGRDVTAEWAETFLHRWVQRGVAVEVGPASPVGIASVQIASDETDAAGKASSAEDTSREVVEPAGSAGSVGEAAAAAAPMADAKVEGGGDGAPSAESSRPPRETRGKSRVADASKTQAEGENG